MPRARQRLGGAGASRWQPPARSLRGRDRRHEARVSLALVVWGKGEQASELPDDLVPQICGAGENEN